MDEFLVTKEFLVENMTNGIGITNKQLELIGLHRTKIKRGWINKIDDLKILITRKNYLLFIEYGPHGRTDSRIRCNSSRSILNKKKRSIYYNE